MFLVVGGRSFSLSISTAAFLSLLLSYCVLCTVHTGLDRARLALATKRTTHACMGWLAGLIPNSISLALICPRPASILFLLAVSDASSNASRRPQKGVYF
ncbi:hypothetical protein HDK64DRAFT_68189 [Phyllosticta capitalensis]